MLEPETSNSLLGTLGINGKLFLAQLFNFSVVLIVMWKWVYTPLLKMMEKRSKEIADGLKNAELAQAHLAEAETEKQRIVDEAKGASHVLLEETRAKAEAIRQEKMSLAKKEIEQVVDEAKDRIKAEKQAAFDALKNEIANLVTMTAEKVAQGIDESGQRQLIAKAITEIENA
jgi:F-type H+-transporting ATPase subunit b